MQENVNPLSTTNTLAKPKTKGFRVMVDDTHIGFLNITENKVPKETVKALQNPAVMAAILAKATLEPLVAKDRDMSGIAGIIAGVEIKELEEVIESETQA